MPAVYFALAVLERVVALECRDGMCVEADPPDLAPDEERPEDGEEDLAGAVPGDLVPIVEAPR